MRTKSYKLYNSERQSRSIIDQSMLLHVFIIQFYQKEIYFISEWTGITTDMLDKCCTFISIHCENKTKPFGTYNCLFTVCSYSCDIVMFQSLLFDNLSVLCTELQENDTIFYVYKLIKIRCLLYLFSCSWRYTNIKGKI